MVTNFLNKLFNRQPPTFMVFGCKVSKANGKFRISSKSKEQANKINQYLFSEGFWEKF